MAILRDDVPEGSRSPKRSIVGPATGRSSCPAALEKGMAGDVRVGSAVSTASLSSGSMARGRRAATSSPSFNFARAAASRSCSAFSRASSAARAAAAASAAESISLSSAPISPARDFALVASSTARFCSASSSAAVLPESSCLRASSPLRRCSSSPSAFSAAVTVFFCSAICRLVRASVSICVDRTAALARYGGTTDPIRIAPRTDDKASSG